MRCGRRPHPAAGRAGHGGSDPRCRSRNSSSGSPTRPETRSRPPRGPRPPPGAPEHRRSRASTRGVPWARTAAIAVPHPTPKSRATAATDAPSWPTRRHTSARARSVNDARGTISGEVSVQVLVEHSWCGHRHTRLTHTRVTGRPAVGRSRIQQGRRSCSSATAPHPGQPTRSAVVSMACSSSPSCSDTASTTNPGKPNIAAAALRSRSTWGLHLRVLDTTEHEAPGRSQAQAEDRVLQRLTTLRNEEPVDRPPVERLRGLGPVAGEVDQPQVLGCDPGSGELLVGGVAAVQAG